MVNKTEEVIKIKIKIKVMDVEEAKEDTTKAKEEMGLKRTQKDQKDHKVQWIL